jgi:hypothetical protein
MFTPQLEAKANIAQNSKNSEAKFFKSLKSFPP